MNILFEHEFFIRIAQSFPFMTSLTIINRYAQRDKQCRKLNNQNLLIIEYPHLRHLDLDEAHDDYVEEILLDTKTCLPYDVNLHIDYKSLKRVTYNFTRNATRINCAKVRYRSSNRISRFPRNFRNYFHFLFK
jgi:hypothetical protein